MEEGENRKKGGFFECTMIALRIQKLLRKPSFQKFRSKTINIQNNK